MALQYKGKHDSMPAVICPLMIIFILMSGSNGDSTADRETCKKSEDEHEVKLATGNDDRFRLDFEFMLANFGVNDGTTMMKNLNERFMNRINSLSGDYSRWNQPWHDIQDTQEGLSELCKKYDEKYTNAFPYSCYTKDDWCLMEQLFNNLLLQLGSIWRPGGPTLPLTQPWYGFFDAPDHGWSNVLINEMKMACETFFNHPSLGSMTGLVTQNREALKSRIIDRIFYYVERNQHENIKAFLKRFDWVRQPFADACSEDNDEFFCQMSHLLTTLDLMIKDGDTFKWDFTLPVPRTREVIAMLWLVLPKNVRGLFPSPSSNEVVHERVQRFLQITFDNVFSKNTDELNSLVRNTANLKERVDTDCDNPLSKEPNALECDFSRVIEDLKKMVQAVKESNWQSSSTLDLRSAILISLLATRTHNYIEVTAKDLREVVMDTFERFYAYAKRNDIEELGKYMKLMPDPEILSIGTERGCSEFFTDLKSKLPCLFQNMFREILTYMNSFKVAPLNTKIISTNTNYAELLRSTQLSAISAQIDQQTIENKANLVEFVNEIKTFVSEESGRRFAALEDYFQGMADFDEEKANADIGYIDGRLESFDVAVKKLQPSIEKKLEAVVIGSVVGSAVEMVQRGVELVVKSIFACNPIDPDPGAVFDAANDFAQSVVEVARSSKLADTFKTVFDETSSVGRRLSENNDFITTVKEIVKTLPTQLSNNAEFADLTTKFLGNYSAYDPKVQSQELAKIATDWETFIGEACDTLFSGETAASAIVETVFASMGQCLTTHGEISMMMEIYTEIYEFQFELMETLATAVRAYQSKFFASRLNTNLRVLSEQGISNDGEDEGVVLHETMLNFYLIYRMHILQVVAQYCNYLEFKNAGEMPKVCPDAMKTLEQKEISKLIAFLPATCTPEAFKFVDISTTDSEKNGGKAWMNMTRIYAGEEVPFQIPSVDWLVANQWIPRVDARDTAIYVSAFELFLPSATSKKAKKKSKKLFRKQQSIGRKAFLQNGSHPSPEIGIAQPVQTASKGRINKRDETAADFASSRSSSQTREIRFKITSRYSAPLYPGNDAPRFALQPYRRYVFSYQENAGSCRQDKIDNPYSPNLPQLCPVSIKPTDNDVDPSVFSLWKIKLEAPEFENVPSNVGEGEKIKAAVRLCKIRKPSTVSKKKKKKINEKKNKVGN